MIMWQTNCISSIKFNWIGFGLVSPFKTRISSDPLTSILTPSQLIKKNNKRETWGNLVITSACSQDIFIVSQLHYTCYQQVAVLAILMTSCKCNTIYSPQQHSVSLNSSTSCSTCLLSPRHFTQRCLNFPRVRVFLAQRRAQLNNSMLVNQTLKKSLEIYPHNCFRVDWLLSRPH